MNSAAWYAMWLKECRRITANLQGACWTFGSWRTFPVIARAAYEAQWPIESLLIWDKGPEVGMGGSRGLRSMYEVVALFAQPEFKIVNRSVKDIWNVPFGGSVPRQHHPAEKPVELLRRLIAEGTGGTKQTSRMVLDPFCGSGSTLIAARLECCRAVGIEIEERYCEIAAKRLQQGALPLGMVG